MKRVGFAPQWLLVTLGVLVVGFATLHARASAIEQRKNWPSDVDELYLPPVAVISRASLGHTELMSDLIAVRSNIYFGEQISTKGAQKWLLYYVNAATELDPYFQPIYLRGAVMLVYNGNAFSLETFRNAERILEKGTHYFPNDWNIWFQLGFNRAFEMTKLVPPNSETYRHLKTDGVEALRRATLFDGVPGHVVNLVGTMLTKGGQRDLAIEHLKRIYASTTDPEVRQQLRNQLKSLLGEQYKDGFKGEAESLQTVVESRYPYAPESFSIILGSRGVAPFAVLKDAAAPVTESTR